MIKKENRKRYEGCYGRWDTWTWAKYSSAI